MGCAQSSSAAGGPIASPVDVKVVDVSPSGSPSSSSSRSEAEERALAQLEAEKLAGAQQDAAIKLQAAARGKHGRKVADKRRHPCDAYCVNTKAKAFGMCNCGWPKSSHSEAALEAAAETKAQALLSPGTVMKKFVKKERAECTKYEVNMTSVNFGECKCGRAKVDHTPAALEASDTSNAANLTSPGTLQAKFVRREKVECPSYTVDLTAARTAQCLCGALRTEHSPAALAAGEKAKAAKVDADALRKTFVQRDVAACRQFKVNLATGGFGECVCGNPRQLHSEEALAGAASGPRGSTRVDADEVRARFVQREKVDCAAFELDMLTEGVPFGTCKCGQPKAKHTDAAIRATVKGGRASFARVDACEPCEK